MQLKTTFQITQNLSHHHEMNETIVNLPRPHSHPKQYHYFHPIPRIPSQKQTIALLISQYTILLLQHLLLQKKEIKLISSLHQEVWMTLLVVKREPVLLSVLAIKVKPCYNFEKIVLHGIFIYQFHRFCTIQKFNNQCLITILIIKLRLL